jgi:hypothetical protein
MKLNRNFLIRTLFPLAFVPCFASADESYLGLFIQGQRIGYLSSSEEPTLLNGKQAKLTRSRTVMDAGLLGAALVTIIDQTNWIGLNGRPILVKFSMSSSGRSQKVEANFNLNDVRIAIDNNGARTTKVLPIPKDLPIVDDALNLLFSENVAPGTSKEFYVLDPMTATFVKNTATAKGESKVQIDGVETSAQTVLIVEPRMSMTVYLSAKGDFLQATALGGMLLKPISKEEALKPSEGGTPVDLAEVTRIPVSGMVEPPSMLRSATYRFIGGDLSRFPIDTSQSVLKEIKGWVVSIRPYQPVTKPNSKTIASVAKSKPMWIQPGLHIACNDPTLRKRAIEMLGSETSPVLGAKRIAKAVNKMMSANAGIGVLRDATEILLTKEGVCRDYAILTASLLRSVKIPTRVVSGLVYDSSAFYYHAWVESWDGRGWFGVDATRNDLAVTPGHIKLAQGSVEDAFLFTFLDQTRVEVVRVEKKTKGETK